MGQTNPAFDNIPFDSWLQGGDEAHIQWSLRVIPPVLGELQRLRTSVVATVDESEVVQRQNLGQLVFFLEVRDHRDRSPLRRPR